MSGSLGAREQLRLAGSLRETLESLVDQLTDIIDAEPMESDASAWLAARAGVFEAAAALARIEGP